jgi:mannosyl-3-phosphoglycerate phosphatase
MQQLKSKANGVVVFTDLDGTLLDENFSYKETLPIISRLLELGVRIVLCSSKTRREIEFYRKVLGIDDPFISENGAAIFISRDYFGQNQGYAKQTRLYDIIEMGVSYSAIRLAFEKVREKCGCQLVGFGDMTAKELARESGLTIDLAKLAKKREYSEPFRIEEGRVQEVFDAIRKKHLCCIKGGKYYHLVGNHDKAKAVLILKKLYTREFDKFVTIGVGDQENDLGMLKVVDKPFLVKGKGVLSVWENILKSAVG